HRSESGPGEDRLGATMRPGSHPRGKSLENRTTFGRGARVVAGKLERCADDDLAGSRNEIVVLAGNGVSEGVSRLEHDDFTTRRGDWKRHRQILDERAPAARGD